MTKTRRTRSLSGRFHLLEDVSPSRRVDRERGIVYGVKILSPKSRNGRVYTQRCLMEAAPRFDGVCANADHPDDPEDVRSIRDRLGVFRNPQYRDGSIYADLHLIKSHPLASSILEAATKPELASCLGASMNADGDVDMIDGTPTVTRILEIRAVDIVSKPATVEGLFESVQSKRAKSSAHPAPIRTQPKRGTTMKITLREWFRKVPLLKPVRKKIEALMEGENAFMDPDAEMNVMEADDGMGDMGSDVESSMGAEPTSDPADMDPESALKAGFRSACVAVLDDTTMPVKDKITRLKKLLTVADELVGSGQEIPEAEEPADEPDAADLDAEAPADELLEADCDEKDKPLVESVQPDKATRAQLLVEVQRLRREKAARDLCEQRGLRPSEPLMEALVALDSDEKRVSLLESIGQTETNPKRHRAQTAPRFDPTKPAARTSADEPNSAEEFASLLLAAD